MPNSYPGDLIAKQAFDVMMRRGWYARRTLVAGERRWQVHSSLDQLVRNGGDGKFEYAADPFTALVEADRWYKENVEGK